LSDQTATEPSAKPVERGAELRRELAAKLPVPDLGRDTGASLVVDTAALDLGGDEIAKPLSDVTGDPHE